MTIDPKSIQPKYGGALGRLSAVMGAVRPTFERRQRLRQCLIKAGAENLPDYELPQVMLFTSNPRADVESLVQELLDRFGSLAEVISADTDALMARGKQKSWEHTSLSGEFYFNMSLGNIIQDYKDTSLADALFVIDEAKKSHQIIQG